MTDLRDRVTLRAIAVEVRMANDNQRLLPVDPKNLGLGSQVIPNGRSSPTRMSKSTLSCLLAVAVSTSLALAQDGPAPGGWSAKPGSGLKYDGGDAFGMEIKNRLQVHWTYSNIENAADTNTFNVRRMRTQFAGHVFKKNILYMIQLDSVDSDRVNATTTQQNGTIKQGWVQWNFVESDSAKIGLRAGQAKTMFGLETTMTSAGLWFVERSSTSRAFADSYSRGAWLQGAYASDSNKPALRWSLGAMNTDTAAGLGAGYVDRGDESSNSDNELSYVFSLNFDPLGDLFGGKQTIESQRQGDWRTEETGLRGTVGVGVALGNGKNTATPAEDVESTSLNLNTAWNVSRFSIMGEYYMRTDDQQGATPDEEEPSGWYTSVAYLLPKSGDSAMQWGLGVRVGMIETDEGATGSGVDFLTGAQGIGSTLGDVTEASFVLNAFYHGHQCKTQVEYTFQDIDPDGGGSGQTNHILRVGFQIEI